MTFQKAVFFIGIAFVVMGEKGQASDAGPPREGLCLWLDSGDAGSMTLDKQKNIRKWTDKSGAGRDAIALPGTKGPWKIHNSLANRPVARFHGKESLHIPGALKDLKHLTIFVVFRRVPGLSGGQSWQRLLTSGPEKADQIFVFGQEKSAVAPTIRQGSFKDFNGDDLIIGDDTVGHHRLWGDIAEIVAYDREFYVDDQVREVSDYLEKKWAIKIDRETNWTREGPLGEVPEHKNPGLPLSDQANAGKWQPWLPMTDEFEAGTLDSAKWWDHNPHWYGRAPGRFLPENVTVADGELQITMRKDKSLPKETFYSDTAYHTWSSGSIKSKEVTAYGYFEIEAKPMDSAGSSAWWFTGKSEELKTGGIHSIELDMFEIGGKTPGQEHSLNMNLHVFQTPQEKRHWNSGGEYDAPFRLADDYHIYGVEWTPEVIRYFLDGSMVRSVKNTHWHGPMNMVFDSETMFNWLGEPRDEDLPSTFKVRYVRAWKNAQTSTDWKKRYRTFSNPDHVSPITKYIQSR